MYRDEYGQAYIYDGYAQGYVKAYENPYTGEFYTKTSYNPYAEDEEYEEDEYFDPFYDQESPEEIWQQYLQHLRDETQQNYKNTDYVKTLSTQYLGYVIL